jgi:hypothetical protein
MGEGVSVSLSHSSRGAGLAIVLVLVPAVPCHWQSSSDGLTEALGLEPSRRCIRRRQSKGESRGPRTFYVKT